MNSKSKQAARQLASIHFQLNEQRQAQIQQEMMLGRSTPLLDFVGMVEDLGGQYKIFRPAEEKRKAHPGGRRELVLPLYQLRTHVDGIERYRYTRNGSVRRVA